MKKAACRGSALALVLWIMAVLFIVVLSFSFVIGSRIKNIELLLQRFDASLRAYSGVEYVKTFIITGRPTAIEMLTDTFERHPDGTRYLLDGTYVEIPGFDRPTRVAIQNESGIVNLMGYNPEILFGLLLYFNVNQDQRSVILDSLADWIDEDDLTRNNGAETNYYRPLGVVPRNFLLLTVDELLLVRGMDEDLFDKIRSFLIIGRAQGINPNTAPYEILMSIPRMTSEAAQRILAFRKENAFYDTNSLSRACRINYNQMDSFFDFIYKSINRISVKTEFGDGSEYVIECDVEHRYGPRRSALDSLEGEGNEASDWDPIEVHFWRETIK